MSSSLREKHVVIIGGGPGGYAAAFKASDLGMEVTLIDREKNPGGVCLFRGCIPSKALLHVSKVLHEANEAKSWGLTFGSPKINLKNLQKWKSEIVIKLTSGLGQLTRSRKITYIQGNAQFTNSQEIQVETFDGKKEVLSPDYTVIATGSRPTEIPGFVFESKCVMDSTKALDLDDIPASLLVIGGGYIGLELGSVYAALGSKVTIVEMTPGLLPGLDRDLVSILEKQLKAQEINIWVNTKVLSSRETKNGLTVTIKHENQSSEEIEIQKILVAVGRKPNSQNLGLQHTQVETDAKGFIKVDEQRRTNDDRIFAIGDVAGEPMLAHKASHEGIVAAEAIHGKNVAFLPRAIPAVVFTNPEIAWCGLSEAQAEKEGNSVRIAKFPWSASGRALTLGSPSGLTKLVIDTKTQRILGVGICGTNAGDLIAEGALAIEMAALASDLSLTIHPHPTLSETVMEAAELFSGSTTHIYKPRSRNKQ